MRHLSDVIAFANQFQGGLVKKLILTATLTVWCAPAFAGLGDELGRWKDDVGNVLEDSRDKIKAEALRTVRHAEDIARKAREESKRLEERVRKLRDELKGELKKLGDVGKALNTAIDGTGKAIHASGKVIEQNITNIQKIETTIVEKKLDPYNIVIESSSVVLGEKLASAISGDRINDFLDNKILGDVKVIDILLPIQSGLERLDTKGVQSCIRQGVVTRSVDGGRIILAGAPEKVLDLSPGNVSLKAAAASVVTSCLETHVSRRPKSGEGALSDEEIANAEAQRDGAIAEMKKNEQQSADAQKYYDEMKEKTIFYSGILNYTKELGEQAKKAQEANQEIKRKLVQKMKEAGIKIDQISSDERVEQ